MPDNDRFWVSVGGSYKLVAEARRSTSAYSHLFVKDTPINIVGGRAIRRLPASATTSARVNSHVDIISVAMHYRWDEPPAPPPKKGYFKAK